MGARGFDVIVFVFKGERRREAWSGDRRRRWKVDGEKGGGEELGRRRERGDEGEEGLRDVIYVQARKAKTDVALSIMSFCEPQRSLLNSRHHLFWMLYISFAP